MSNQNKICFNWSGSKTKIAVVTVIIAVIILMLTVSTSYDIVGTWVDDKGEMYNMKHLEYRFPFLNVYGVEKDTFHMGTYSTKIYLANPDGTTNTEFFNQYNRFDGTITFGDGSKWHKLYNSPSNNSWLSWRTPINWVNNKLYSYSATGRWEGKRVDESLVTLILDKPVNETVEKINGTFTRGGVEDYVAGEYSLPDKEGYIETEIGANFKLIEGENNYKMTIMIGDEPVILDKYYKGSPLLPKIE